MDFKTVGAQYKVPENTVKNEYNKLKEEFSKTYSGDELETIVIEHVHLYFRKQGKSKTELFFGVVVGYDKPKDMATIVDKKTNETKRDFAIELAKKNLEDAISVGKVAFLIDLNGKTTRKMVTKEGKVEEIDVNPETWKDYKVQYNDNSYVVPLDNTKKFPTGNDNPNYLKPLPLNQWTTDIEGIIRLSNGAYRRFVMAYNQPKHPGKIKMNTPVEFRAISKGEKDGVLQLRSSVYTEFVDSTQDLGADAATLVGMGYSNLKLLSAQLEEYHSAHASTPYDTLVLLDGYVADIRPEAGIPYILLDDFSKGAENPTIKVYLHDGISIDFGIETKVFVLGRTSQKDKWDPETKKTVVGVKGDVTVWAMGVVPKYTKPKVEKI